MTGLSAVSDLETDAMRRRGCEEYDPAVIRDPRSLERSSRLPVGDVQHHHRLILTHVLGPGTQSRADPAGASLRAASSLRGTRAHLRGDRVLAYRVDRGAEYPDRRLQDDLERPFEQHPSAEILRSLP